MSPVQYSISREPLCSWPGPNGQLGLADSWALRQEKHSDNLERNLDDFVDILN